MADISVPSFAALSGGLTRRAEGIGRVAGDAGKLLPGTGNSSPVPATESRKADLSELVDNLNNNSRSIGRSIRFQVDFESQNPPVIQVLDRETGQLIRQIPADQAAVLAARQGSFDVGRIIDVV